MSEASVLYVADLARKLGKTESAIRMAVHRDSGAVPPHFYTGRRMTWLSADVDAWLKAKARRAKKKGGAK